MAKPRNDECRMIRHLSASGGFDILTLKKEAKVITLSWFKKNKNKNKKPKDEAAAEVSSSDEEERNVRTPVSTKQGQNHCAGYGHSPQTG